MKNIIHPSAKIHPNVNIGSFNSIGKNVVIDYIGNISTKNSINIGDNNIINDNTRIFVKGNLNIGDWNVFHNDMLIMTENYISIEHNCWFGQNTILDGTGGLKIGSGVRVGMYSQVWTHVGSGELIEGCTLFSKNETIINNEVWLVGSCVVGSGIELGKRSVYLINSLITKNTLPDTTYSGSPVKIMKNLHFYKPINLNKKFDLLKGWLIDFCELNQLKLINSESDLTILDDLNKDKVIFTIRSTSNFDGSVFFLNNKTFFKTNSYLERKVYKFLYGNKARFNPIKSK